MEEINDLCVFFVIFLIGLFGFICSIFSLYLIFKKTFLHNAYGLICAAHSVAEAGILACFICWSAPIILLDKPLGLTTLGIAIGALINYLYYNSLYFHVFKSINRFCAIVLPFHYRFIFSLRHAKILIFMVAVLSFIHAAPFLLYECNFYFNTESFTWMVRDESCANATAFYIDIGSGTITAVISFFCDTVTFCYLRVKIYKKAPNLSKEVRFVTQAYLTTLFYALMLISFHITSHYAETFWTAFCSTTVAWQLCHTFNQLSFIIFIGPFNHGSKVKIFVTRATQQKMSIYTSKFMAMKKITGEFHWSQIH